MSALLSRYLEAATLRAFAGVAAALTALFSLLEFVEQLASVGQGGYRVADALAFVALTAPGRMLQLMPVSMLLASLLALGPLARTSELTAMLALGISERRVVGTVLRLLVPIVAVLLLLAEFVIPPAQQMAQDRRADALGLSASGPSSDSVWAHDGREYLDVERFEHGRVPVGIDIYSFEPDGSLASLVHAARGTIGPAGTWALDDVSRRTLDGAQFRVEHLARLDWHSFIQPGQLGFLTLPPDSLPPFALLRHIRKMRKQHQNAVRFERALWNRAAIPLSMAAMALIAAPLVFGAPRLQGNGQRLARGIGVGIVFSLFQQITGRLGELLAAGPAVTALAPPLVLLALAIALLPGSGGPGPHRKAGPRLDPRGGEA